MGSSAPATTVTTAAGTAEVIDTGGDGPAVLFVHGTPGGCDQGELMTRFLVDEGFRVVAPSRPGYRATPLTDDVATPVAQAALHAALLDELGIDQVALMCWSGGGPSSYQLAIDRPERITAMAAIAALSGPYSFEHPGQESILFGRPGTWLMKEMGRHSPKSTVKMLVTEEGDLPKDQAKELVAEIWADEARRAWVLEWLGTVTGDRKTGFTNDRHQYADLSLDLASVRAPVLLVHADTDSDVPYAHSEHAAASLADVELVTIAGGTHISLWTGPDDEAARAAVLAHLRR